MVTVTGLQPMTGRIYYT